MYFRKQRKPKPCEECGELIPFPIPRGKKRVILCASCAGDSGGRPGKRKFPTEKTDIDYHGDLFYRGEW